MKRVDEQLQQFYYHNENLRFTLGTLVVMLLCSFLIVVATFTQFNFIHHSIVINGIFDPIEFFHQVTKNFDTVRKYDYIPQIPVIIFISALLGRKYGLISVLIYMILGLTFFPIFALGGGITYIAQYNFGYIIAYPFAVLVAGKFLDNEFDLKKTLKAVFLGVLLIHIIGAVYFMFMLIVKHDPWSYIGGVFNFRMVSKFCYDILFSFFAVYFARLSKSVLWLAMG